jgi:hypothetical protein
MFTRTRKGLEAVVFLASAGIILVSVTSGMPEHHRGMRGTTLPLSAHSRILSALRKPAPLASAPFSVLRPHANSSMRAQSAEVLADPIIELAELSSTDEGDDFLGFAVAISGDTIVAGSPAHTVGSNSQQGAAYVFVKPAGGWTTMTSPTAELTAADGLAGDNFGLAVGISGDTIAVGSCSLNGTCANGAGKVYVFEKPASGWASTSAATAVLTASDSLAADGFGVPVAIAGDTVVVGEQPVPGTPVSSKAYVFVKLGGGWSDMTETAQLTASDEQPGDDFGEVSVSADGNTILVGAPSASVGSGSQEGAAYVFVKPASGWATTSTFTAKLTAADEQTGDGFCQNSGCLSADGSTVVAAAPQINFITGNFTGAGKAYVYVRPAGGWATTSNADARITSSDEAFGDAYGFSAALSNNADEVAIGSVVASPTVHGQGAVYSYKRPAGGWVTTTAFDNKLLANNAESGANLGFAVAEDAGIVVGGAITASVGASGFGAAYVFGNGEPFSISAASGVNVSSPGQSGSTTLTISPTAGFIGTVTLSCTPDASANESNCSFTSGSTSSTVQVNLNGSNADVTFNVTTVGPHQMAALRMAQFRNSGWLAASAILLLLVPIVHRRRRVLISCAALTLLLILVACGGGGGGGGGGHTDPGTAAGNYTFTVTGTSGSGSSAATVSTSVAVTVQ